MIGSSGKRRMGEEKEKKDNYAPELPCHQQLWWKYSNAGCITWEATCPDAVEINNHYGTQHNGRLEERSNDNSVDHDC